jgi:tetraacyldisaccharide 4'-kinase
MHGPDVQMVWPVGGKRILETTARRAPAALQPLLFPIELAYRATTRVRNAGYDFGWFRTHRVAAPVISVGNIVAGGAGKTPVTRYLTDQLLTRGRRPAVLHGGYGADEPRLHSEWHPDVVVLSGKDRVAPAEQAIARGADVILLDDAFQHRRLARDLDIVLVAAESANVNMIPRGPAREPLPSLRRSSFVIVTRKCAGPETAVVLETKVHQAAPAIPTARVHLRIAGALPNGDITAVSSIARPDVFLKQIQEAGARVVQMFAYPDHYEYTSNDARHILERARGTLIATTAKDAVKLRALLREQPLHVVDQQLVFESGEGELMQALDNVL